MASPGDRPVFVMPGFLAGDGSTMPLRRTLDRLGHTTYGWDLGRNLGPTPEILDGIVERIDELHQKHGPIDVVGWSLGGISLASWPGLRRTRSDR